MINFYYINLTNRGTTAGSLKKINVKFLTNAINSFKMSKKIINLVSLKRGILAKENCEGFFYSIIFVNQYNNSKGIGR